MFTASYIIQIHSGITCGRVFSGELYTERFQKQIFLYLSTGCLVQFSLRSSGLLTIRQLRHHFKMHLAMHVVISILGLYNASNIASICV